MFDKLFSEEILKRDLNVLKEKYLKAETKTEKEYYARLLVYLNSYAFAAYRHWFNFSETNEIIEVSTI